MEPTRNKIKVMLIQEEGRLKKMNFISLYIKWPIPVRIRRRTKPLKNVKEGKIHKEMKCFFMKNSHLKNDCLMRKAWFEKKDTYFISVCFESNLIEVTNNTWWLDSGITTYVSDNT